MAWYAKQPPPRPDWDTCWDFSKTGMKSTGGDSWGSGQKSGYRKKNGGWQNWGASKDAYNAWQPDWWPATQVPPWALPAYQFQPLMPHSSFNPTAVAADDDDDEEFKSLLEKRLQESGSRKPAALPPPPPPDKEYEGSLKSLSSRNGYGFIVCQEAHRVYGRDVYLPEENVPEGAEVRDRLKFTIALSTKGHPQALNVSVVGRVQRKA